MTALGLASRPSPATGNIFLRTLCHALNLSGLIKSPFECGHAFTANRMRRLAGASRPSSRFRISSLLLRAKGRRGPYLIDVFFYLGHPSADVADIVQNFFVFGLIPILEHIGHDAEKPGQRLECSLVHVRHWRCSPIHSPLSPGALQTQARAL